MTIIEQADRIVDTTHRTSGLAQREAARYRRGAYCEWLGTHPTDEGFLTVANSIEELAAEVVRIDAASKAQPPEPAERSAMFDNSEQKSEEFHICPCQRRLDRAVKEAKEASDG